MRRVWMIICVVLLCMITGCGNDAAVNENAVEQEEPVWVITEQRSYDAEGNLQSSSIWQYTEDENHYRVESYNKDNELTGYSEVSQNKDATQTVKKNYLADGTEVGTFTETFDSEGKLLSSVSEPINGQSKESIRKWSVDGRRAEVFTKNANGETVLMNTLEYDDQNRIVRETDGQSEAVYSYEDGKRIIRSEMAGYVYYMVHYYDAQNRMIETRDYKVPGDGDYTEDNLISRSICIYKEDGHSLTHEYHIRDEVNGEQLTGTLEITYQPLDEVLAK
ncbi:MAG: hypothetical protein E7195_08025 [Peptococcaceae bacterium]|nr:hypothetical protein [Peptococcaceae bacterium]